MSDIYTIPRPTHVFNNGLPITPNGYLHFFEAGTSAYKAIYADAALTVELDNPAPIDSAGRVAQVFYGDGKYKIACTQLINLTTPTPLYPVDYTQFWEADNVDGNQSITISAADTITYVNLNEDTRNIDVVKYQLAYSKGGHQAGDGFGGWYRYESLETAADDGGWYFQPSGGGAGRWVRIQEGNDVNLGIWNITPGTEVLDSKYASATVIAESLGLPVRIPPGVWYWNGPITVLNANARTIHSEGIKYRQSTVGTLTLSGPATIENTDPLIHNLDAVSLLIQKGTGIQEIDARWYKGTQQLGFQATAAGLPVVLNETITLDAATTTSFGSGLIVNGGCTTINIPDDGFIGIHGGAFVVNGPRRRIFTESDTDRTSNRVGIYKVATNEAQSWWWGYGYLSSTDQSLALKRALSCCHDAGNLLLRVNAMPVGKTVSGDATPFSTGDDPCPIVVDGPIPIASDGVLTMVAPINSLSEPVFTITGTGSLGRVQASAMSPEWFGCSAQSYDNYDNFMKAAFVACINRCPLVGANLGYQIGTMVYIDYLLQYRTIEWRNFTLLPNADWDPLISTFVCSINTATNVGNVVMDNVGFGTTDTSTVSGGLIVKSGYARLTDCTVFGDLIVTADDYVVKGCTQTNQVNGVSFYSAALGGKIVDSLFTDSMVVLMGESAARPDQDLAQLSNVTVIGNTFRKTDESLLKGDLILTCGAADTLVSGVVIENNTFTGIHNGSGGWADRARIKDKVASGNWYNTLSSYRHTMKIGNNTCDKPNTSIHSNLLPATFGMAQGFDSILPGTYTDSATYAAPPYPAPRVRSVVQSLAPMTGNVFILTGDTISKYTRLSSSGFTTTLQDGTFTFTQRCLIGASVEYQIPLYAGTTLSGNLQFPDQTYSTDPAGDSSVYTTVSWTIHFSLYDNYSGL